MQSYRRSFCVICSADRTLNPSPIKHVLATDLLHLLLYMSVQPLWMLMATTPAGSSSQPWASLEVVPCNGYEGARPGTEQFLCSQPRNLDVAPSWGPYAPVGMDEVPQLWSCAMGWHGGCWNTADGPKLATSLWIWWWLSVIKKWCWKNRRRIMEENKERKE